MKNKQWPYFVVIFLLPLLLVFWWWGAFNTATVEKLSRPAVRYAYLISEGEYSKAEDKQNEVLRLLKQQGIAAGQPITLIEDDPRATPAPKRHAQAGILIAQDAPALKAPLLDGNLPERQVLVVSARGHPFLVYGKAYGALMDVLKAQNMRLRLPIAETTHDNTLTIEMTL
jgi:hypothetical protein